MDGSTSMRAIIIGLFGNASTVLLYEMRWWLLACLVLTIADFKFGLERSMSEGKKFRKSTAIRRTMNKLVDYIVWILVAGMLAHAIGEPAGWSPLIIESIIMAIAIICEVESICQNYFESRGYDYSFSFKAFFVTLLKKKNEDLGDAVDKSLKIEKDDKTPPTT